MGEFYDLCDNDKPLSFIAGPCVMENHTQSVEDVKILQDIFGERNWAYKASFDKANRTSHVSKRGLGLDESFYAFSEIEQRYEMSTVTDIHENYHAAIVPTSIIQIPALLCRQTDLLAAAAGSGKTVAVKKGQFCSPHDVAHIVEKLKHFGCEEIIVIERGSMFGYNNLIVDMKGLQIIKEENPNVPLFVDITHTTQIPGATTSDIKQSGGNYRYAETIGRAAVATGIAGIFLETHRDPLSSPSDGPCLIPHNELKAIVDMLIKIDRAVKNG